MGVSAMTGLIHRMTPQIVLDNSVILGMAVQAESFTMELHARHDMIMQNL